MWAERTNQAKWFLNRFLGRGYYPVSKSRSLQKIDRGNYNAPVDLVEALARASQDPKLVISPTPYSIDLGIFGSMSEGLLRSDDKEWASSVCINEAHQFWWPKQPVKGDAHTVERQAFDADDDFVSVRRHIMNMHSHGKLDTPIHIEDVSPLFGSPISNVSTTAELVITSSIKMLALRTHKSPLIGILDSNLILPPTHETKRAD